MKYSCKTEGLICFEGLKIGHSKDVESDGTMLLIIIRD